MLIATLKQEERRSRLQSNGFWEAQPENEVTGQAAGVKAGEWQVPSGRHRTRIFASCRQKLSGRLIRIFDDLLETKCGQM